MVPAQLEKDAAGASALKSAFFADRPVECRPFWHTGRCAEMSGWGLALCKRAQQGRCDRGLHLLKGKLDFAAYAFWREHEINHASDLVRDEITYEINAVAGLDLRCYRGAPKLAPH